MICNKLDGCIPTEELCFIPNVTLLLKVYWISNF